MKTEMCVGLAIFAITKQRTKAKYNKLPRKSGKGQ